MMAENMKALELADDELDAVVGGASLSFQTKDKGLGYTVSGADKGVLETIQKRLLAGEKPGALIKQYPGYRIRQVEVTVTYK